MSLSHKQTTYIIDLFKDYLHHDFHFEWHSPDRIDKLKDVTKLIRFFQALGSLDVNKVYFQPMFIKKDILKMYHCDQLLPTLVFSMIFKTEGESTKNGH